MIKTKKSTFYLNITLFSGILLHFHIFLFGCIDENNFYDQDSESDSQYVQNSGIKNNVVPYLNLYTAKLSWQINYTKTTSANIAIQICTSNERCYSVTGCTTTGGPTIWTTQCNASITTSFTGNAEEDDHPLVNNPDDWDNIFLKNNSSYLVNVNKILISVEYTKYQSVGNGANEGTYSYVDWNASDSGGVAISIEGSTNYPLWDLIRQRRECIARSAFCGQNTDGNTCEKNTSLDCSAADPDSNPSTTNIIADVVIDNLALPIQQAIDDIGQVGLSKYNPFQLKVDGQGCWGAPGFHLSNYAQNLLVETGDFKTTCIDPSSKRPSPDNDNCGFYSNFVDSYNFGYFRYWTNPDELFNWTPPVEAIGTYQGGIWIDQFISAGRAAKILFDINSSGNRGIITNGNPNGYTICRLDKSGIPIATLHTSSYGTWYTCYGGAEYTPQSGDFFAARWGAVGQSHVMLWLGAKLRLTGQALDCAIEENGKMRTIVFPSQLTSSYSEFYFGETKSTENWADYSFGVGQRIVQQAANSAMF